MPYVACPAHSGNFVDDDSLQQRKTISGPTIGAISNTGTPVNAMHLFNLFD